MAGAFTVMPFVKYPPNPPGVGDPATLAERQWKYVALIFLSLVVLAGAARLSGRLRQRGWLDEQRLIAVALAVVVPLGVVCAVLPPFSDAVDVPANLLWRFRIASLGGNLLLWSVLTVGFGAAAARRERELAAPAPEATAGGAFRLMQQATARELEKFFQKPPEWIRMSLVQPNQDVVYLEDF